MLVDWKVSTPNDAGELDMKAAVHGLNLHVYAAVCIIGPPDHDRKQLKGRSAQKVGDRTGS